MRVYHDVRYLAFIRDAQASLGLWKSHFGAGVKVSNLKINSEPVVLNIDGKDYPTGMKKFGCILGDEAEIGCNSVLNPGTLIGKRTLAVTNLALGGYIRPDAFIKLRQNQEIVTRK